MAIKNKENKMIFMIGIAVGSFLNVLIDRLPQEETILGRSHCDHCKKDLKWNDLIPILSYVYLGAQCRYCGKKLSLFYPLVEVLTGAMFVFVVLIGVRDVRNLGGVSIGDAFLLLHTQTMMLLALLGIVSASIVIFFSDWKFQIIPDSIQISLFAFSFLYIISRGITPKIFLDQAVAAFAVMLPILLVFYLSKGKGMGFGDVKLAFSMGFLLGIFSGFMALYIGFISGAIVGVTLLILGKKKMKSEIAFGPFLVLGMLTMLFFENNVLNYIRQFFPL